MNISDAIKQYGFMEEWSLSIAFEPGEKPSARTFANFIIECCRIPNVEISGFAPALFSGFIVATNEWSHAFKKLKKFIPKEDLKYFKTPEAEAFYHDLRAIFLSELKSDWAYLFTDWVAK